MSMSKMRRRTNQADVARVAGVSISTVSRVLSDAPGISEDVRREVRNAAQELGYQLRASGRSNDLRELVAFITIGRVTGSVSPMYQAIIEGIRREAGLLGVDVTVRTTDIRQPVSDDILQRNGVGVMFVGLDPGKEIVETLKDSRTPVVLVNGLDPRMRADAIAPANFFGGRQVAKHLTECGHTRTLHITDSRRWTIRRRMEGFQAGLREFGADEPRIIDIKGLNSQTTIDAMDQLLQEGPLKETAAFCTDDAVALSVIEALGDNGIRVPSDFSVVGFDDMPYAGLVTPLLTTVHVDWEELGREAARLAHGQPQRAGETALQVQLSVRLVKRESVAVI